MTCTPDDKTGDLMLLLERGTYFGFMLGVPDPGTPEGIASINNLWERVRPEFMAHWIRQHPGSRPWAWWRFDAPELRRTDGRPHPFDRPEYRAEAARIKEQYPGGVDLMAVSWGRPRYNDNPHGGGYESDFNYLDRLDLLEDSERR